MNYPDQGYIKIEGQTGLINNPKESSHIEENLTYKSMNYVILNCDYLIIDILL